MIRLRFNDSVSSVRFSHRGAVRDVPDELARHLIASGVAEAVGDPAETAVVGAPETAASRPRRKRGLGRLFPQG